MEHYPKISIITPSYNSKKFIEETITSVISQKYPNLEYIIMDGASTDGTLEIIRKYEEYIAWWDSEPDKGMYDAINKGFKKSTGEIMMWINSDDILFPKSLFAIAKVFNDLPEVQWIHGQKATLNHDGIPVYIRKSQKFSYYSYFLDDYRWIQQEAVAWKRSLYENVGGYLDTNLKFAGDFELWTRFSKVSQLHLAPILIGGFRVSGDKQLSKVKSKTDPSQRAYDMELKKILLSLERPKNLEKIKKKNSNFLRLANNLPNKFATTFRRKREEILGFAPEIYWDGKGYKKKQ